MAKPFPWTAKTLLRAEALAQTVDLEHWLSTSGKIVLKIIDVLAKPQADQQATASQIVDWLAGIGQRLGWDMNNMTSTQEKGFLVWLVNARMAGET